MSNTELNFIIRPYQESDESDVIKLWHQCNLVVPQNDPQRDIALKLKFQPNLFLIGVLDHRIIASVMVGYEGHRGWINYLAVSPEFQGRGFGRLMMEKAEEELKKFGCLKINLQVRSTNKTVIDFYKHLGFSIDDVVNMGKRL